MAGVSAASVPSASPHAQMLSSVDPGGRFGRMELDHQGRRMPQILRVLHGSVETLRKLMAAKFLNMWSESGSGK